VNVSVRKVDPTEYESVQELLIANGWAHRVSDSVNFCKLLDNSQIAFVALNNDQIIGFIRAITDQISNGYISMLVVHSNFRRQGVGKTLVHAAMSCASPSVTWTLRAGRPGASDFFAALGFSQSKEAMELKRRSV
jgi:ribosomal protein S18 acetylase RimI-like enzyme